MRLEAGRVVVDEQWRPRYGPAPDRSYGWDPVIGDEHVFWMDNGRNRRQDDGRLGRAAGSGAWWARHDDSARSVEISGLPHGTESNPPAWDPEHRVVVGYDAGNAVSSVARSGDDLEPLWRRTARHAGT